MRLEVKKDFKYVFFKEYLEGNEHELTNLQAFEIVKIKFGEKGITFFTTEFMYFLFYNNGKARGFKEWLADNLSDNHLYNYFLFLEYENKDLFISIEQDAVINWHFNTSTNCLEQGKPLPIAPIHKPDVPEKKVKPRIKGKPKKPTSATEMPLKGTETP